MNSIPAYQLDAAGLLIGETVADESPLEPGVFPMPAGCIDTAPPAEWPDGQWPRWNGIAWYLVPKPVSAALNPVEKLAAFLAENPDVAALIDSKNKD